MDSDRGVQWGVWKGEREFCEFVRRRGEKILKEKRQKEKLPAHTEWVAAHTEWIQDEVTSSWVPEPGVSLFEREVDLVTGDRWRCNDFNQSLRWLPVKARMVDCVRVTYNRSEIVEGGRNVTENEWWWGGIQEGESNQGMTGGEGEASGGVGEATADAGGVYEEYILSDGGEEGEASGEPTADAGGKPVVEFILSDIGEEGMASEDDPITDAGEDAGVKTGFKDKGKSRLKVGAKVGAKVPLEKARKEEVTLKRKSTGRGETGSRGDTRKFPTLDLFEDLFHAWERKPGIPGKRAPPLVRDPPLFSLQFEELNRRADQEHWRYILRQSEADREIVRQQEKQKRKSDTEAGPSGLQRLKNLTLSVLLDRSDSESD